MFITDLSITADNAKFTSQSFKLGGLIEQSDAESLHLMVNNALLAEVLKDLELIRGDRRKIVEWSHVEDPWLTVLPPQTLVQVDPDIVNLHNPGSASVTLIRVENATS